MQPPKMLMPLLAAVTLTSCAAAVIPVVVSGVAARQRLRHHGARVPVAVAAKPEPAVVASPEPAVAVRPEPAVVASPVPLVVTSPVPVELPPAASPPILPPVPRDPAQMTAGVIYTGSLPSPYETTAKLADPTATDIEAVTTDSRTTVPREGWIDLLRYVARGYTSAGVDSVLLMRGSSLAVPHWVRCGAMPKAVLVSLEAVIGADGKARATAVSALDSIETIGVTVVYTSSRFGPSRATVLASLAAAGLHPPKMGTTLLAFPPGQEGEARAMAAAHYCVIALASHKPEDFPNRAPDSYDRQSWPAGWFFLPRPD